MNRMLKSGAAAFALLLTLAALPALAAETKIAVINIQEILLKSTAGATANDKLEKRGKELKDALDKDKQQLMELKEEMKKKFSVWSDEKKREQEVEFQKKGLEFEAKQDKARREMKRLEDEQLAPLMNQLKEVVKTIAKNKGISVVLPNPVVFYSDSSVDITGDVIQALNSQK